MSDTLLTVIGNLTGDPELRFTATGVAVVGFTIASTPRTFDRKTNEWVDGEPLFMRCSAWREHAENIAESLTKGTRVIAQGKLAQRTYETNEGEKRTVVEMQIVEIGAGLSYATAKVTKRSKGQAPPSNTGGFTQQQANPSDQWQTPPAQQAPPSNNGFGQPQMPTAGNDGWAQGPHPTGGTWPAAPTQGGQEWQ